VSSRTAGASAPIRSRGKGAGLGALPRASDTQRDRHHRQAKLTPKQARVLAYHDAGMSLTAIARLLGWKPNAKGKYDHSGIQVMLDVALNKTGRSE